MTRIINGTSPKFEESTEAAEDRSGLLRGILYANLVLIVLQVMTMVGIVYDRQHIRKELDDNARLIDQLQRRKIINDLNVIGRKPKE